MLLLLAAALVPIETFSIREVFSVTHPLQIVDFDSNRRIDPEHSFMIGPQSTEVPFQLLIGDDSGVLHKFAGIFLGTPAEVTTVPWPATLGSSLANVEGQVYVGYYPLFTGAFDKIYLTSSGASPTGHLYVCSYHANFIGGQSVSSYYLGDGYPCSAVTEFYNTAAIPMMSYV